MTPIYWKEPDGYVYTCHWCGEPAVETVDLSLGSPDQTGYVDRIDICADEQCRERTQKAIKMKRGSTG
jgi:hypothetical protein